MKLVSTARLASAMAVAALVAACSDQPMPLAPSSLRVTPSAATGTAAGAGQLRLCKTGNGNGTFGFSVDVQNLADNSHTITNVNVAVGACVQLLQLPTSGSDRRLVSITENTLANWSLTGITVIPSSQLPINFPTPVVDVPNRNVSGIGVSNDYGAEVTFDNLFTPPPGGCTYTLGYWKTHSLAGPAPYDPTWALLPGGLQQNTIFFKSGNTYLTVFNTPPAGNSYYQLAHQYMAAELNILGGASSPAAVVTAMASAKTIFQNYTPAQIGALAKNSALRAQIIALAGTLDQYNNGLIGPGHCGNE